MNDDTFKRFPLPWQMAMDKDNSGPFMYDAHGKLIDIRIAGFCIVELINKENREKA